jgi:hypothetical protein
MVNNADNSKLYDVIKEILSNYEAQYNAADWEEMQNLLNLSPKSNSFKFKHVLLSFFEFLKAFPNSKVFKFLFSRYSLIGLAVIIGIYFLYTFLNSPKTPDTINSTPQQKIENTINTATSPSITPSQKPGQNVPKVDKKIQQPININDSIRSATNNTDIKKSNESETTKKENEETKKSENFKIGNVDTIAKSAFNNIDQVIKEETKTGITDSLNSSGKHIEKNQNSDANNKNRDKIISDSLTKYLNLLPQDSLKIPK